MATLTIAQPLTVELPPMSEAEFYDFCRRNKDLRIERTAQGEIMIMSPAGLESGDRNSSLIAQLRNWAERDDRGIAFDSNTGFTLPSGAVRSPGAAWVSNTKVEAISAEDFKRFAHVCPEFVIELLSPSDSLQEAQAKMREWIENGTELGWLVDPGQRIVFEYTPGGMRQFDDLGEIQGHGPVESFTLDLRKIWKRRK